MGATSRSGKPNEWAARINHTHIIKDEMVNNFLSKCSFPKEVENIEEVSTLIEEVDDSIESPIKFILAVDGGYTNIEINKNFPTSEIAFFQFGALNFAKQDLLNLSEKPFIFPEDMQKLNSLQRWKLTLPIKNINYDNSASLTHAFRKALYEFFMVGERIDDKLIETVKWIVFEEYSSTRSESYILGSNPYNKNTDESTKIELKLSEMSKDYTWETEHGIIYLTDVFRLHEAIDDDFGASGVLGYVTRLVEQMILFYFIHFIYKTKPNMLKEYLFIADGALSFAGQTATMHKYVRKLCTFLQNTEDLFLVGIEKSGAFVDHIYKISTVDTPKIYSNPSLIEYVQNPESDKVVTSQRFLEKNHYLILNNSYMFKYILIGDENKTLYGDTSYYSGKVLFHTKNGQKIVLTVPIRSAKIYGYKRNPNNIDEFLDNKLDLNESPPKDEYKNLDIILKNIYLLKCDMYDNSIVPIALANKLVSLSNIPSQMLLDKFASEAISK